MGMKQWHLSKWALWHSKWIRNTILGSVIMILTLLFLPWTVWPRASERADLAHTVTKVAPGGVPAIGQTAPDFTLASLHHDQQTLSDWEGQPVLINFWASWCGPCRREMPELIAAHERYQAEGLVVLAVNLSHQDTRANAEAFVEEFQPPFPVLLDTTGEVSDKLYGARGLPMSFFIGRSGQIRRIYVGAMSRESIDQFMAETLAE